MENEIENINQIFDEEVESIVEDVKTKKTKKKDISKNVFNSLHGKLVHIKVGNEKSPATDEEISTMQEKFDKCIDESNIDCIVFVTHHAVEIITI